MLGVIGQADTSPAAVGLTVGAVVCLTRSIVAVLSSSTEVSTGSTMAGACLGIDAGPTAIGLTGWTRDGALALTCDTGLSRSAGVVASATMTGVGLGCNTGIAAQGWKPTWTETLTVLAQGVCRAGIATSSAMRGVIGGPNALTSTLRLLFLAATRIVCRTT